MPHGLATRWAKLNRWQMFVEAKGEGVSVERLRRA